MSVWRESQANEFAAAITLRQQGVRLVYSVGDKALIVTVAAVDGREDGVVYDSAVSRLFVLAVSLLAQVLRDQQFGSFPSRAVYALGLRKIAG